MVAVFCCAPPVAHALLRAASGLVSTPGPQASTRVSRRHARVRAPQGALLAAALAVGLSAQTNSEEKPKIEPLKTSITVNKKIDAEVPGVVSKLDGDAIESRPGLNLDDRLRDVPGFSLFRRSSSLTAHPTTQGISLRGIGSSGASRTLVLLDGTPLNDPFGGWVYWTRFNPDALDSIEISRGASSSVY